MALKGLILDDNMKHFACSFLFFLCCCSLNAQTTDALKVKQTMLSNGLTVWLNVDHSQPKVFGAVVVKAGAKDAPNTGIAHYFEHIMFKGTDKIGTIDYPSEKVWLDSIAAQYDLLSQTKDELTRKAIQQHINQLSIKAADYAIPNEFPHLIARLGGSGMNAGTSYDLTQFYNTFSPQFIEQWATLNCERFIHPVFRLFQGELETVYEEKNMYADNMLYPSFERAISALCGTHPYAYPVIGSTENLKNPRLSDMEAFFKKYYVASNMGLILCGDFDADAIMPILEKTFGRINRGEIPTSHVAPLPALTGQEVKINLPIPIVKAEAMVYHAPTDKDADATALDMAVSLLSNTNKTGYLDSLMNVHQVMLAAAARMALNDAGAVGFAVVPNIPFGSKKKAEQSALQQIEKLKKGEFPAATLEALKLSAERTASQRLEDMDSRAQLMMTVFSQGRSWEDYLRQAASIASITKEDIMRVANKYFNTSYMKFVKKYGSYPKDKIQKPDFKPIVPKHLDATSEFAKSLLQMPVSPLPPRLLDFNKDAKTISLNPHATLYVAKNPVNDLFSISLNYHKGTLSDARLEAVAEYMETIGTDSLSKQGFGKALQRLGTTFDVASSSNTFSLHLSGYDRNLKPSLLLLRHFISQPKADPQSMKYVVSNAKLSNKSLDKSNDAIADAILEKVEYGDNSYYLRHPSVAELKQMKSDELLSAFRSLQSEACDVVYSGSLSAQDVAAAVRSCLPIDKYNTASEVVYRPFKTYSEPVVYYYNLPNARQTVVSTYQTLKACATPAERAKFALWGNYFGNGGFSSLLMQEIREFRSYAYYAHGHAEMQTPKHQTESVAYITKLSTQTDKTMLAINLLDSLFQNMPLREQNITIMKQQMINDINNSYPSFRGVAGAIANYKLLGYNNDPRGNLLNELPSLTMNDIMTFYKERIQHQPQVLILIGNKEKMPLQELSRFGKLVELKKADIYR